MNQTPIAYIYTLIDPRNSRIKYVGKTINPNARKSSHITESKIFNHHRAKWIRQLTNLNLKPIFEIVKVCPLSDFEKYETEYISLYQSKYLTNSDESGQGNKNRKRDIIENANYRRRKVYQYDINGNFLDEFKSTREAGRKLDIYHSHIVRCCNCVIKHTHGFIFTYDKNKKIDILENPNSVKKSVIEIDIDGKEINRWNSVMNCSRDAKIDNGNISRVCNGKRKSIKGRFFKFDI